MLKKFNVVAARTYKAKDNSEKTAWLPVGTITEFDNGGRILELNMFPNQNFKIFEQSAAAPATRPARPATSATPIQEIPLINIDEEIKAEDLPF